jgi:outer membrane protein OmpA-like peptidoglycan-associated protein
MSYWLMTGSVEKVGRAAPVAKRTLQRKCDECHKKKPELQRSDFGSAPKTVPPIVHEVLRSPGSSLDATSRDFFEPRFAHDFSSVRVHTDARAAESAREVNAQAYTVGKDMVFGAGAVGSGSAAGRRLMAHELAHVVQQSAGTTGGAFDAAPLRLSSPSDPLEREAHDITESLLTPASDHLNSGAGILQQRLSKTNSQSVLHRKTPEQADDFDLGLNEPFGASMAGSLTLDSFALDKAELTVEHTKSLGRHARRMQKILKLFPDSFISVVGHTDASGTEEHNKDLGLGRAEAVRSALVAAGVPGDALRVASLGKSSLRFPTSGHDQRNRRVEIMFTARNFMASRLTQAEGLKVPTLGSRERDKPNKANPLSTPTGPVIFPPRIPEAKGTPLPSSPSAQKATAAEIGRIKELTELIKKVSDAAKRDPLVRELRDLLSKIQPVMPAKDAKKMIDDAIEPLVKEGLDAGIKAILEAVIGKSPSPLPEDRSRSQIGPALPERDLGVHIFQGPKIPIKDAPALSPRFSFQYRNGPRKSYEPGATIRFTIVPPDNFSSTRGAKHLVIVAEADRNARNPDRIGERVELESASPTPIELQAPQVPGRYVIRVDIGFDFDYNSVQEFDVNAPQRQQSSSPGKP